MKENSRTESKEDKEQPKKDKSAAEIADTEKQKAEAAQTEVKTPESQELHTQSVTEPDSTLVQNSETVSPDQECDECAGEEITGSKTTGAKVSELS